MDEGHENRADPLLHSRLRLGRARKRFGQLGQEVTEWVKTNQPRLNRRFDSTTGWTSYHLGPSSKPPKELVEGAGIVSEDLLVALNVLVGGLGSRDGETPEPPRFPICLTVDEYFGTDAFTGQRRRLLRGVASPDSALIDSLQPYHRVDPSKDPLARLQKLHECHTKRELRGVLVVKDVVNLEVEELKSGTVEKLGTHKCNPDTAASNGLEILRYRTWPDPSVRLKVDIDVKFDLRLDPPRLTISELDRIRAQVERSVRLFDTRIFPGTS